MTYQPRFTDLGRVRRALRAPARTFQAGGADENDLLNLIQAVEEHIVEWCDPFELATLDETARIFRGTGPRILLTDRYPTSPSKVEYSRTGQDDSHWYSVPVADWWPAEPVSISRSVKDLESHWFNAGYWYRVLSRWGWETIPSGVREASTLLTSRLYARQTTPLGLVITDEGGGYVSRMDSDVKALLGPYLRLPL